MKSAVEHPGGLVRMAVWDCGAMQSWTPGLARPVADLAVAAAIEILATSSALTDSDIGCVLLMCHKCLQHAVWMLQRLC